MARRRRLGGDRAMAASGSRAGDGVYRLGVDDPMGVTVAWAGSGACTLGVGADVAALQ